MSGPKASEYQVKKNALEDEQARIQAIDETVKLKHSALNLLKRFDELLDNYSDIQIDYVKPQFDFCNHTTLVTRGLAEDYLEKLHFFYTQIKSDHSIMMSQLEMQRFFLD